MVARRVKQLCLGDGEMMTPKEQSEVVLAAGEGKVIEYSCIGCEKWVSRINRDRWDFSIFNYRVKPEPKRLWVNRYNRDSNIHLNTHLTKKDADSIANSTRVECIPFIELTPEIAEKLGIEI